MKTTLPHDDIAAFLRQEFGTIKSLTQMVEGEESQALSFVHKSESYVVRINPSIEGFKKDNYAYTHFYSEILTIPKVIKLGKIDSDHAFCISEMIEGITMQDSEPAAIDKLLIPLTNAWKEIGGTDISYSTGFGEFDSLGNGTFKTWRSFILSVLDYDWNSVVHIIDHELYKKLSDELKLLAARCPAKRSLVHGDFGANNILVKHGTITAVIDWENALYGAPLYDIAIANFWRTWLVCMEKSAAYWEAELSEIDDYRLRIRCYQLRIALAEIFVNATDDDTEMVSWLQDRSRQVLEQ